MGTYLTLIGVPGKISSICDVIFLNYTTNNVIISSI